MLYLDETIHEGFGFEMTIKEVARKAGVSIGTVSNVVNNKPNVASALRDRVEKVIAETGYTVNLHARGMILKRTFNIGILVPSLLDPLFPKIADFVERMCEQLGFHVIIASLKNNPANEERIIESLRSQKADGLIYIPCSDISSSYFRKLIQSEYPCVLLNRHFRDVETPFVIANNKKVSKDILQYLISKGHSRIDYIVTNLVNSADEERYEGLKEGITQYGFDESVRTYVYDISTNEDGESGVRRQLSIGYEKISELIQNDDLPTAVFTNNDYIAAGCMKACFEHNVSIPDQLSLISVGNQYPPELLFKRLTTYEPMLKIMSETAVNILYKLVEKKMSIKGNDLRSMQHIVDMNLIEGETVQRLI